MATMKLVATSRAITDITMPKTTHGVNPARTNQSGADTDRQLLRPIRLGEPRHPVQEQDHVAHREGLSCGPRFCISLSPRWSAAYQLVLLLLPWHRHIPIAPPQEQPEPHLCTGVSRDTARSSTAMVTASHVRPALQDTHRSNPSPRQHSPRRKCHNPFRRPFQRLRCNQAAAALEEASRLSSPGRVQTASTSPPRTHRRQKRWAPPITAVARQDSHRKPSAVRWLARTR